MSLGSWRRGLILAAMVAACTGLAGPVGRAVGGDTPATQPAPLATADPAKVYSEADAWRIGWPMLAGPYSNLQPLRTDVKLVDDLAQARLAWISEERAFGTSKTGSQTFVAAASFESHLGPKAETHPGNWAGVIVAEGKVFASSFRPTGTWYKGQLQVSKGGPTREVTYRLDAEDLTFALDAHTGKTLWKSAEPGGILAAGGKRGGFQVAPVYYAGKVFSMGTTGRLFAYDAATGRKLWQGDIGPAHAAAAKERDQALATAAAGTLVKPDAPGWHSSLTVADGVLIVPSFTGGNDTGLRGVDVATGALKWEVKGACSKYATPAVWRHADREYVLTANLAGVLRLIDPRDGKVRWEVTGLGPTYFTLAPSPTTVLVNINPSPPKSKDRIPGYYGAYRITPDKAELAWKLPQEPAYQIPTWFDTCARQRYTIANGVVLLCTEGNKDVPGRFLLIAEDSGKILDEHLNQGDNPNHITELVYVLGDRLITRSDHSHGASRGGRHPLVAWSVAGNKIKRLGGDLGPSGLDLVDFTNAYEVLMEVPLVAGRMFERVEDGRLACYDLRKPAAGWVWRLELAGGYLGMPSLPVTLWTGTDGAFQGAKSFPPTSKQAALPLGKSRTAAMWESSPGGDLQLAGDRLAGTVRLSTGTQHWPVELELTRAGDQVTGTWKRPVPALGKVVPAEGPITGRANAPDRVYPTPWLADSPWTSFGPNPTGTTTWILQMGDAMALTDRKTALTVSLDVDGQQKITRATAAAFGYSQGWPEVDASGLTVKDGRITGELRVVLNGDSWMLPNPAAKTGIAGRFTVDAKADKDEITGTFKGAWGEPWTATGAVTGTLAKQD